MYTTTSLELYIVIAGYDMIVGKYHWHISKVKGKVTGNATYSNLLNVCKKHPLYIVRTRKILETVYKVVNELCPTYLSNLVHVRNKCINFRSKNNLTVPKFNTITHGKESFRYKAPYFWNTLSNNMKNASSLYSFKSFLSEWAPSCICTCGFCILCKVSRL